ncbi:16S rRNA (adenine(1518)-N(6)/adenine(1519)-N(6))-dimethyltransferase RsmA [Temperatibacter marinus]|uniref:Ribosomal RNA small subunit methyltransferase A n=1 Tax=Temperatibacter marinus TaxID=1456591 RepID=A0AA52EGZ7_9PROT|nr:16S rRNA (adenine(1518)-N(6)/adenine(1519)-N(6))-dimethyltransferase RsmA [Temperatibacter marinus]WND02344.1 16S rRNA (adenine(1518)-N(6)/adenine(1519)-N(6))-dimethyltransferase RsmA [Temperatibacter marinus]
MTESELPPLREVINSFELRAKKSFGQNFLLDLNLTRRIARIPGDLSKAVVYEVGPGPGGLTRALLMEGAGRVQACEMDKRCIPALAEVSKAFDGRLSVYEGDALKIDEHELLQAKPDEGIHIVSNLPYNVGTMLLIRWLTLKTWTPWWQSLTLMFQKEVAERIVAAPGTKEYGRLSILAQWRSTAKIAMRVPAAAFTPPPKVNSAIIHLKPTQPLDDSIQLKSLELVVEKAFQQRRKMLRSSLKGLSVDPKELLKMAEIEETERAENVSVADFVKLAKCYEQLKTH